MAGGPSAERHAEKRRVHRFERALRPVTFQRRCMSPRRSSANTCQCRQRGGQVAQPASHKISFKQHLSYLMRFSEWAGITYAS